MNDLGFLFVEKLQLTNGVYSTGVVVPGIPVYEFLRDKTGEQDSSFER